MNFGTEELSDPSDVFVDSQGNVFVADTRNDRILKMDVGGNVIALGDGRGTDAGQLDEPRGVFVDSNGMIYVADTRNDRVQKFDSGNTDQKIKIFIDGTFVSFDVINPFDSPINQDDTSNVSGDAGFGDTIRNIADQFKVTEYKIDNQNQNPNSSWSVPATIISLDKSDKGKIAVVSVNELAKNQEIHISINNNEGLANGGIIKGIQFVANENINSLKFGASFTEEPKDTIPKVNAAVMYMTFEAQGLALTNSVNLDQKDQFKETPSISFVMGPIENSNHLTHPTSVKSGLVQCPNINLASVSDTGATSFNGISVFRNTNGDTTESCGYTAFLEHFSTYAVIPAMNSGGGGGSGDKSPPSIRNQVYDDNEFPLVINGLEISELNYSNKIDTHVIETGEKFNLTMLINDNSGKSAIEFVGLFTNLNGHTRQIHQSDTYITFDSNNQLQFFDPNEFFSDVDMTQREIDNKLELSFDVTFEKEMQTSDIIIRMWDTNRNSQDTILSDVIKVTESKKKHVEEKQVSSTSESSNMIDAQTSAAIQSNDFRNMIEKWGGTNQIRLQTLKL